MVNVLRHWRSSIVFKGIVAVNHINYKIRGKTRTVEFLGCCDQFTKTKASKVHYH